MSNVTIPTTFSIDFISGFTKVNELISKTNARIYYRGGNRNGTWITDEFAEKLNQTLPHVPIVASYNAETEDFEDHADNGSKKAYGFVPTNAEMTWVTGDDGREYLQTECFLWTGYWPEASKLQGKSLSMELEKSTIMGDWKVIGGDYYFVYATGAFKGLCGLGDTVTPCFEESAFYALDEESRSFFNDFNKMNEKNSGGEKMEGESITINGKEMINETIVVNSEETVVEEVLTTEEATASEVEVVADFVEGELDESGEGTSEPLDKRDRITIVEEHSEASVNQDGSITVINTESVQTISIATYYELQKENAALKAQLEVLQTENFSLTKYKDLVLKQEKMAVIDSFKKKLTEEEVSPFIESLDKYSTEELKTELSVILSDKVLSEISTEPTIPAQFVEVPFKAKESGIESILKKNKRN